MAHSNLLHALRRVMREYRIAEQTGVPVDEVRARRAEAREAAEREGRLTRRDFLVGAGALAAAAALPIGLAQARKPGGGGTTNVPVAIVGAGMAGLAAAIRFKDAGVTATLYESQMRVGGRLLTDRSVNPTGSCGICHAPKSGADTGWADGQYVDVFGELIDSPPRWHHTWQLMARYPWLQAIDMWAGYPAGSTDTYWFSADPRYPAFAGGYYTWDQVVADFEPVYRAVLADERAAPYPTRWDNVNDRYGAARIALDNLSIYDWIETRVPGGHASPMGRLLDAEYNIEYGVETTQQSAMNLIYLLAYQPKPIEFSVFGESDERWKLAGGIDGLTTAMADEIGWDHIKLGWALRRLTLLPDGTYSLSFANGQTVRATYVLLCLPFSALRASVDFSAAGFDPFKVRVINEMAVGHNGKMALQFTRRLWNEPGPWGVSNGNIASDNGCQYGWDATRGVPGTHGILINYTGGNVCDALQLRHPLGTQSDRNTLADAQAFLRQAEQLFPGITPLWNGKVVATKAHLDPNYLCGYGSYVPGGYTAYCGYERVPQGNVYFAGEHTSIEYFGYFEGAAEEAWDTAELVLSKMGYAKAPARGTARPVRAA